MENKTNNQTTHNTQSSAITPHEDSVGFPKIENTCKQCLYGVIVNPYHHKCGEYLNGKPKEIFWEGQPCPKMKPKIQ